MRVFDVFVQFCSMMFLVAMIVVSLSFSSWPRPRLRPRLVTPNLMTSLGTWKKVSTWAALKWIVQGKLQCLTHTGGSIVTISALSREIREEFKGHVRQPPINPLSEWLSKIRKNDGLKAAENTKSNQGGVELIQGVHRVSNDFGLCS